MILVALIVFAGAMLQGMVGFGMALVVMPLLVTVVGIQVASPSFAVVSLLGNLVNAWRWHVDIDWGDVRMMLIPALVGAPLGVLFLSRADPVLVTRTLGVLLVLYAGYSLLGRVLPIGPNPGWAYAAGFLSGAITGAFNAGGPPVVAYAATREWSPDRFKGTMAAFFLGMGVAVVVSHALTRHLTAEVWQLAALSVPAMLLGQQAGVYLGRRVSPARFNQLVLVLLLVLGVQLLI
jgi:uncharacterized membrane protein YfcA